MEWATKTVSQEQDLAQALNHLTDLYSTKVVRFVIAKPNGSYLIIYTV